MENQRIYETTDSHNYIMDFPRFRMTYFEIPKNGSSTVKKYLLTAHRQIPVDVTFAIGQYTWKALFPEVAVDDFANYKVRRHKLVVIRDPVSRIKSAYQNIWCQRMKNTETLKEFLEGPFIEQLKTPRQSTPPNHFKPQSWFLPDGLIDQQNVILVDTKELSSLPKILSESLGMELPLEMEKKNESNPKRFGTIDADDGFVREKLMAVAPEDFDLYAKTVAQREKRSAAA